MYVINVQKVPFKFGAPLFNNWHSYRLIDRQNRPKLYSMPPRGCSINQLIIKNLIQSIFCLTGMPTDRQVMRGHFRSRDKDGGHTIGSAITENSMAHANRYRTGVIGDRSLHCGNRHFGLDSMTFIYELDLYSIEIHRMYKYELPMWRLSKVIVWQTDIQADRFDRNYTARRLRISDVLPRLRSAAFLARVPSPSRTLSWLDMPAPPRAQLSFPAHIDHYSAF